MAVIDYIDGAARRIYLSPDTVGQSVHPIDIYKEMRTLRKDNESLRKYDLFMEAKGNDFKGGGKYTERYAVLLQGTRIVPYDATHSLTINGTVITDDGQEGVACFDRAALTVTSRVDINYVPPQVEVITINGAGGGSGLTVDQDTKLTYIYTNLPTGSLDESSLHTALDSYTNKADWKANSVDLTAVLNAINALHDISLADVEGSTILAKAAEQAKEATLDALLTAIEAIPTTHVNLYPVVTAIQNLNDVSAAQVREAFDEAEFKDKNTEDEFHAWLDTYANKHNWKSPTVDLSPVIEAITALNNLSLVEIEGSNVLAKEDTLNTIVAIVSSIPSTHVSLTPVLNAITGLNDVTPAEVRAAFNAAEFKDKNTEAEFHLWLNTYGSKGAWKADPQDIADAVWNEVV